jgi:hypothetical protein
VGEKGPSSPQLPPILFIMILDEYSVHLWYMCSRINLDVHPGTVITSSQFIVTAENSWYTQEILGKAI